MMEENMVRLLCRFGGDFVWKLGEVHCKGGENRIVHVDRVISYTNLLCKVQQTCKSPVANSIKYKYPGLGLDTLVSIENDDDIWHMMQAFPKGSEMIQLFISFSTSAPVTTPRKLDNNGAPKATLSDIHHSNNNISMPLPNDATLCNMDLQHSEDDIFHEEYDALSDNQESVEVADDIGRDNSTTNLRMEDISHNACREYTLSGTSKFKERLASFPLANKLTTKTKSFKPNHNHKHKKAVIKVLEDYGTSAIDLMKAQPQKHSVDILKCCHKETDKEIKGSLDRTWRGKELALATDHFDSSIVGVLTYCLEIHRSNPGSVVVLNQTADGSLRVFLAYRAAIHGFFQACRQILMLKSFHIKVDSSCTWLLAVSLDANNNAFPFACAIVKLNDQENWVWFCEQLSLILGTECKMTFVWDRREIHAQAIYDIFPNSYCRYFRELLIDEFSENFGCLDLYLVPLFHQATYAYTRCEFNDLRSKIYDISSDAWEWMDRFAPKQWARSHLEGEDYDGYDDFEWEFDTWIHTAQGMSMVSMLESFHYFMMNLFRYRIRERSNWKTTMTPFVEEYRFNEEFVPVRRKDYGQLVDLKQRKCLCCEWQVRKIPCDHAVEVILSCGLSALEYCDMCYTVGKYEETYSEAIYPCLRHAPIM